MKVMKAQVVMEGYEMDKSRSCHERDESYGKQL